MVSNFSAILEARKEWNNDFKILKENYFQPRILCLWTINQDKDRIKTSDMQGLKNCATQASFPRNVLEDIQL